MNSRFWVETLGCPKNRVDSDKLVGRLGSQGLEPASRPEEADVVVVNTCAFIEEARMESISTVLDLAGVRKDGAKIVITGCMAERYGDELSAALPEADLVAGFGRELLDVSWLAPDSVPVEIRSGKGLLSGVKDFDLLNLPRPGISSPWAYIKVAEGCDRSCGFCAIPSFRGRQQSRTMGAIIEETALLGVKEAVLVAQDLASYGRDIYGKKMLIQLMKELTGVVEDIRLLYLYPLALTPSLVEAILDTGIAYFDLSLQHVSRSLLAGMRRWGSSETFLERIEFIRSLDPNAALRSSFIIGYPGESEEDHDALLRFIEAAQLDWSGFFAFSDEEGTHAHSLDAKVPKSLMLERLAEVSELQDSITAKKRIAQVGSVVKVLVDAPGEGRSFREAPEIDGIVSIDRSIAVGERMEAFIVGAEGPDLIAKGAR